MGTRIPRLKERQREWNRILWNKGRQASPVPFWPILGGKERMPGKAQEKIMPHTGLNYSKNLSPTVDYSNLQGIIYFYLKIWKV